LLGAVALRAGDVPHHLADAELVGPGLEVSRSAVLAKPHDGTRLLARILVRGGNEIIVAPVEGTAREIEPFILGSGMAAIVLQNGQLPIHASAVSVAGTTVAFAGPSGAGKSTIAESMAAHNCACLADDMVVVEWRGGRPIVHLGGTSLKLHDDSIVGLGLGDAKSEAMPLGQKWGFRREAPADATRTLDAIFLLEQGNDVDIEPVTGLRAVAALSQEVYRGVWLAPMGLLDARVRDIALLAQQTRCFRLRRPYRFDVVQDVVDAVLRCCNTLAPTKSG